MAYIDTDRFYKFSAPNAEAVYGYGSEELANSYLAVLNIDRETDLFEKERFEPGSEGFEDIDDDDPRIQLLIEWYTEQA